MGGDFTIHINVTTKRMAAMNLTESIFQMMREGRKYSSSWIAKRNNLPLSSVRASLRSLVRGGVVEKHKSQADKRRSLYETKQHNLLGLFK